MTASKKKLIVAGIVTSIEFQKCKFFVQKLVKTYPKEYDQPDLRPMLNVAWKEYLWKIRRTIGGKVWTLRKNAVVLLNNEFLGDDVAVFNYVAAKTRVRIDVDFYCLGILELKGIFDKAIDYKRKFAYLTIAIEQECIGSLLFLLYADHVPRTVKHFLRRCQSQKRGWVGRPLHRLVKGSWAQIGGFDLENRKMPCENYIVPHDRRGVLSTCHEEKHINNTTQLVLSLAPTPWMDYKFVAFGQLIQGDEVLKKIEAIETDYESPKKSITVWRCGEYSLDMTPDPAEVAEVQTYLEKVNPYTKAPIDILDSRDVPSQLSVRNYDKGLYCLELDLEPHPALNRWHIYYETARPCSKVVAEGYSIKDQQDQQIVDQQGAVDTQQKIRQWFSNEQVEFKPERTPSEIISFDGAQKLDTAHTPSVVLQIVEDAFNIATGFSTPQDEGHIKDIVE